LRAIRFDEHASKNSHVLGFSFGTSRADIEDAAGDAATAAAAEAVGVEDRHLPRRESAAADVARSISLVLGSADD
jgi:hypothetical protein